MKVTYTDIFIYTLKIHREYVKCLLKTTASSPPQSKVCLQPHKELIRLYVQDSPAYSCRGAAPGFGSLGF